MKLLLDTHTFLWGLQDSPRLSTNARDALRSTDNDLLLSIASIWELSIKAGLGQLDVADDLAAFLTEQIALWRIQVLGIEMRHAVAVRTLPQHHRDPFDRLLVAQSQIEEAMLVTDDRHLREYDVRILW